MKTEIDLYHFIRPGQQSASRHLLNGASTTYNYSEVRILRSHCYMHLHLISSPLFVSRQ